MLGVMDFEKQSVVVGMKEDCVFLPVCKSEGVECIRDCSAYATLDRVGIGIESRTCRNTNAFGGAFICSGCGYEVHATQTLDAISEIEIGKGNEWQGVEGFNYCPNCGRKVVK